MEGGCTNSTFLGSCASLPMVSESLALAALVGWSRGEIFCCFPVLAENCDTVLELEFRFLLVFQGDNTR
jgi:hypothetical protein